MGDGDDDDDEGEGGDEYSDDEDTSYKTRRSATKVLAAVIGTRPELLSKVYQNVSPVLISRFGDREESVKIEVWATYVVLLNQTGVYGRGPESRDLEVSTGTKRKRTDESMEVEDAPMVLLRTQVAALSKALLKQLQPKSSAASLQAGFQLFIELLVVLPGSVTSHASPVLAASNAILALPVTTNTAALHTTVLSFLVLFFSTHPPTSFGAHVSAITPTLLTAVTQKHPRIAAEAFKAFSALLQALKPIQAEKGGDWALQVYKEANNRLSRNDTDAEVRAAAEVVIGDLWICATSVVSAHPGNEWDSLRRSGRPEGAVQVVTKVAAVKIPMGTTWSTQSTEWVLAVIRKSGRGGRVEAFRCLDVLISR
jgi:cullin-associated NEDD8-dissociated protein 1